MHKSKFATKLVNVCAWCGKEQYGVFDDSASTTHGICQKCRAALSQDENKPLVYIKSSVSVGGDSRQKTNQPILGCKPF